MQKNKRKQWKNHHQPNTLASAPFASSVPSARYMSTTFGYMPARPAPIRYMPKSLAYAPAPPATAAVALHGYVLQSAPSGFFPYF